MSPPCPSSLHQQVIVLQAENAVLLDRTRHRRIDPLTEKVYQLGGPEALSPRIAPVTAEGAVDKEVLNRWVQHSYRWVQHSYRWVQHSYRVLIQGALRDDCQQNYL